MVALFGLDAPAVFPIVNASLPAWILLAVAPSWRYTMPIVTATILGFAVLYVFWTVLILISSEPQPEGDFFTLDGLVKLFASHDYVFVGWVHYVVFDLCVGRFEVQDAQRSRVPHLLVVPCLFFTLMSGPMGLLLYGAVRHFFARDDDTSEEQAPLQAPGK
eukprot:CAMPEP_0174347078 /NCGR_PEP_ID=MMETSP0811_2-20130205/3020_1 /TAXON_ID=73025 ORGANISM="Eutreptiella gymnastica-like, Strain CCMP1594" /NCGR_SAMPLE_ID=MMETSP0811_2 /ASSEMBLY_ACC=CAM_ASM_000667 /LENGTH=160 /DNA_ID=CAMNT_0015472261 /DNA_START=35 /DNA_END=517 /DNA_ORIENTATION=+